MSVLHFKVRSPKSVGFMLWASWISVTNAMAMFLIVIKTFQRHFSLEQSGGTADQLTLPSLMTSGVYIYLLFSNTTGNMIPESEKSENPNNTPNPPHF